MEVRVKRKLMAVAVSVAVLAVAAGQAAASDPGPASASAIPNAIGPVKVLMQRGPLKNKKGRPIRTVTSVLGSQGQSVALDGYAANLPLYLTVYPKAGISVYYERRNEMANGPKSPPDRVAGVVSSEKRYGLPIGSTFSGTECIPIDRRIAPDEGPPRVSTCFEHDGSIEEFFYMEAGTQSRADQRISMVGLFRGSIGVQIHRALILEALENLECSDLACSE
jgi:hypothetical protein